MTYSLRASDQKYFCPISQNPCSTSSGNNMWFSLIPLGYYIPGGGGGIHIYFCRPCCTGNTKIISKLEKNNIWHNCRAMGPLHFWFETLFLFSIQNNKDSGNNYIINHIYCAVWSCVHIQRSLDTYVAYLCQKCFAAFVNCLQLFCHRLAGKF